MKRNYYVLLVISIFFGLAFGIYELALPLYLKSRGFSPVKGSLIFAVSACCAIVVRLVLGRASDVSGRKRFYVLSLLGCGLSSILTPFFGQLAIQCVLKSLRESSVEVRKTIHSVLLYESLPHRFLDFIGKTQGAEFLCQAFGALIVGYGLGLWHAGAQADPGRLLLLLMASGIVLFLVTLFSAITLREPASDAPAQRTGDRPSLGALLRLDRRLALLTVAMFVFYIGLGTSHGYVMPLFFKEKFGTSYSMLGWIMALHRATISVPLLLAGQYLKGRVLRHEKRVIALFLLTEGVTLALGGILPDFAWATGIWLLHDFFGAGIWSPINNTLMQRYSRKEYRGNDVAVSMSVSWVGFVVGAMLGGVLFTQRASDLVAQVLHLQVTGRIYGLPFIVGGGFMILTCPFYIVLHWMDREPHPDAA